MQTHGETGSGNGITPFSISDPDIFVSECPLRSLAQDPWPPGPMTRRQENTEHGGYSIHCVLGNS